MTEEKFAELDLSPWSLAVVDIQNVTEFDDHIIGTSSHDRILGKGGDDLLEGFSGNDTLNGNFGDDTLKGGSGDDVLKGGWGDDRILGEDGNDFIAGTHGNNYLNGGSGNDTIVGSDGVNHIVAGIGNDTINLTAGVNYVEAGSGNDVIIFSQSAQNWAAGFGAHNVSSEMQNCTEEIVSIEGFQKINNVINGGHGWDTLHLSSADDALFLDDQYSAFHPKAGAYSSGDGSVGVGRISGIEQIYAGQGNDLIDLTSSRFSLAGTNIEIYGEEGNDTLWGSDANETISGGDGDDFLFGGRGNDVLTGGRGADTFDFSIMNSGASISDFNPEEGDLLRVFGAMGSSSHSTSWNNNLLEVTFNFGSNLVVLSINLEFGNDLTAGYSADLDWGQNILFM